MVGAKNFSPRRRTEGSPLGADGPCRRTINARRVRAAHHTGPGEGPGDAVPVFAVRFVVVRGGASVAGIGPGPAGGVGAHVCCGFGNSSFLPEIRKKIRNFSLFFCDPSLLSDCSTGGRRSRRSGRGPRPRPNLPKEREIFSNPGRPCPAGFPVFGKTENRNRGRWRGRVGNVVVGEGVRGGVFLKEHAGKKSFLRNERDRLPLVAFSIFLA